MKNPTLFKLKVIEDLAKGDTTFTIEMLQSFAETIPPLMNEMSDAIDKKDSTILSRIAHRLKPSFHYIGRDDIHNVLNAIENDGDLESAIKHCKKLMNEMHPLLEEINSCIEELKKA